MVIKFNLRELAGLVDSDLLHHLASELGEEWRRLAQHLDIRSGRIQAILRSNAHSDSEQSIYNMLLTWVKKVPRGMNKVLSDVPKTCIIWQNRKLNHN